MNWRRYSIAGWHGQMLCGDEGRAGVVLQRRYMLSVFRQEYPTQWQRQDHGMLWWQTFPLKSCKETTLTPPIAACGSKYGTPSHKERCSQCPYLSLHLLWRLHYMMINDAAAMKMLRGPEAADTISWQRCIAATIISDMDSVKKAILTVIFYLDCCYNSV